MSAMRHRFVEEMPPTLEEGVLYVCLEYNSMSHLCACGCGNETVTPLGRTEWRLSYDGETVSVHPSIGNWSLPCRSHYVLKEGRVHWAEAWNDEEIEAGRRADRHLKRAVFDKQASLPPTVPVKPPQAAAEPASGHQWLSRGWRWLIGRASRGSRR